MRFLILILMMTCIFSCNTEDEELTLQIGEDFVQSATKVYFIDTLTVKTSSFQFDSLSVSNANRVLVGAYNDPVFGKTSSRSFAQFANNVYYIDEDAVYDSIALILKPDKYFYNDTIPNQRFKVFKVLEDIEPDEDYFYNTTSFNYNETPIGVKDFFPTPNKTDSLEIKIDDAFGLTLFNKIRDNEINSNTEFLDEYKGLLIEADSDVGTAVLGYSTGSFLRLYYTLENSDNEPEEKNKDFAFSSSNTFNQISSDKTGTYFENLTDQETFLTSSDADNSIFIQAGTAIVTRLDIPNLKTLNEISTQGVVVDAKLKFTLKENLYSDYLYTRDSLKIYLINNKSNILTSLPSETSGDAISIIENTDSEFGSSVYSIDIKAFINLKLEETYDEYFLAIYSQDFNNSVDRYIFNDNQTSNDLRMKLELTYATYE